MLRKHLSLSPKAPSFWLHNRMLFEDGGDAGAAAEEAADKAAAEEAEKGKAKNSAEARIKELTDKANAAESKLKALEDEKAEAARKAAEAKGEFEKLYQEANGKVTQTATELEATKKQLEAQDAVFQSLLDKELATVPESHKERIGKLLGDQPAAAKLNQLGELKALLGTAEAAKPVGSPPGGKVVPEAKDAEIATKRARQKELLDKAVITPTERGELRNLTMELKAVWEQQLEASKA